MTDIVDRLRDEANQSEAWCRSRCLESADEIERLRRDRIEDWSAVCERQRVEIERLKVELAEIERITWREGNSRDDMQRCLIDIRKVAHP